jgi:hypothetical protein
MIGKNAVELDLKREYPKLHPVFNLSLVVPYVGPNELINRGVDNKLKEKFYRMEEVVDWSLMENVLDAQEIKKGKYEYLVGWKNLTIGNQVWIADDHFSEGKQNYLLTFRKTHAELFGDVKKKKKKLT